MTPLVAAHDAGAVDVLISTHWVAAGPHRHVALSVRSSGVDASVLWDVVTSAGAPAVLLGDRYDGSPALRADLGTTVALAASGTDGRAAVFPGVDDLTGTLSVRELLDGSAIDEVAVLAGGVAAPGTSIVTRDFVRPRWSGGRLVLHCQPAAGGVLVPFETPSPTPCCADHA